MAQIVRLECTTNGHNKFYEMTENGDGTFTARYGAIGTSGATKTYPMSRWPSIYNDKMRKGYVELQIPTPYQRPSPNGGGPKYGFTGETRIIPGTTRTAYRIVSKIDFIAGDGSEVRSGDKGGWVERNGLLRQNIHDPSWVADEAVLYETPMVTNGAVIKGTAKVYCCATVSDFAVVKDGASVCDHAVVTDGSVIYGHAIVFGNAKVTDKSWVNADIDGDTVVDNGAWVDEDSPF